MAPSYFANPFAARHDRQTPGRKRRRSHASSEHEVPGEDVSHDNTEPPRLAWTSPSSPSPDSPYYLQASLPPSLARQYRVAGQRLDASPPAAPFPHRAAALDRSRHDDSEEKFGASGRRSSFSHGKMHPQSIRDELQRLYPTMPPATLDDLSLVHDNSSLKQRHVETLTALLHRCLLQGDFLRAGRAFGLLLRTDVQGQALDLRQQGLWGIGAEILLRRETQSDILQRRRQKKDHPHRQQNSDLGLQDESEGQESDSGTQRNRAHHIDATEMPPLFSRRGFRNVQQYYERLILEYPYRAWSPERVSTLQIWPVYFGMWIGYIQDEHKRLQHGLDRTIGESKASRLKQREYTMSRENDTNQDKDSNSENVSIQDNTSRQDDSESETSSDSDAQSRPRRPYRRTLARAAKVAARMDKLLVSFPFSDQVSLWRLRGMLAVWMADLTLDMHSVSKNDDTVEEDEGSDLDLDLDDRSLSSNVLARIGDSESDDENVSSMAARSKPKTRQDDANHDEVQSLRVTAQQAFHRVEELEQMAMQQA